MIGEEDKVLLGMKKKGLGTGCGTVLAARLKKEKRLRMRQFVKQEKKWGDNLSII